MEQQQLELSSFAYFGDLVAVVSRRSRRNGMFEPISTAAVANFDFNGDNELMMCADEGR